MEQKLKKIMVDLFRIQENRITDDLSMDNTESWDSLKHMELIAAIEEEFGILLTADEIVAMTSLVQIKDILLKRGVKN